MSDWIPEVGDIVKVKAHEVDSFISDVSRKIKNRVGVITNLQSDFGMNRIWVTFLKVGRRKEFKHFFDYSYLELISKLNEPAAQ
jgi:hypothetical protein